MYFWLDFRASKYAIDEEIKYLGQTAYIKNYLIEESNLSKNNLTFIYAVEFPEENMYLHLEEKDLDKYVEEREYDNRERY
ncbi:MAG: hypothetical protein ACOC1K_01780 [Nanoarchaeota archaeon]